MSDILEDYDFVPSSSSGSNLRSLFDDATSNFENNTLIYTAPKQPRNVDEPESKDSIQTGTTSTNSSNSSVVCVRIVNAWTLIEGKYKPIGKCGFAIIKGATHNEVILYKERHNVLVRVPLHETFQVFSKKNNFASFYDDNKTNWLINFNNSEDCLLVSKHFRALGVKVVEEAVEDTSNNDTKDRTVENDENKARADILSRIAKMGQSILPITEEEESVKSVTEHKTERAAPIQNSTQTLVLANQLPTNYDNMNMLENRTQNIEMRLNMAQISEKLNKITEMIANKDKGAKPENLEATLKTRIKVLELQNENLSKELTRLKEEKIQGYTLQKMEEATKCKNYEEQIKTLSETINQQNRQLKELNEKIQIEETKWVKKVSSLEEIISSMNEANDNFPTILKEEMNVLYSKIIQNSSSESVAQNVKQATLNIIQKFLKP